MTTFFYGFCRSPVDDVGAKKDLLLQEKAVAFYTTSIAGNVKSLFIIIPTVIVKNFV